MMNVRTHIIRYLIATLVLFALPATYAQSQPGDTLSNTAHAAYSVAGGPVQSVSSNDAVVTVPRIVRMTLTKTASTPTLVGGGAVSFSIIVQNSGNVPLDSILVRDTLDVRLTGPATTAGTFAGRVLSWTVPRLAPGASDSVRITATLPAPGATIMITNVAHAAFDSLRLISDTVRVTAQPLPSVSFTKTAPDSAFSTDTLVYVISVVNTGSVPVRNAVVVDSLVAPLLFVSASDSGTAAAGTVRWTLGDLLPGATRTLQLRARVDESVLRPVVPNRATLTADMLAPADASDSTVVIPAVRTLTIAKTASADSVRADAPMTYTIVTRNTGNVPLDGIVVTDTVDAAAFLITGTTPVANVTGTVVSRSIGVLRPGSADTLRISVRVRPAATDGRVVLNAAYASAQGVPGIGRSTASVTLVNPPVLTPVLRVTKRVSVRSATTGDTLRYTIGLRNAGNTVLRAVAMTDTLPSSLAPVSVSGPAVIADRVVTWSLDSLTVGAADSIVVTVLLSEPLTSIRNVVNRATAASSSTPPVTATATFQARVPVPDASCRIHITVTPRQVIGNGMTAAVIRALVTDTLGNAKPDGTPVTMTTQTGFFSNGLDSIVVETVGGVAVDSLRAIVSSGTVVTSRTTVTVEEPGLCSAQEFVNIIFFPGAIEGIVTNSSTGRPVEGAVVTVTNSAGEVVAVVTTGPDGTYLIPVPRTDTYTVTITTTDDFQQPVLVSTTVSVLVPGTGGNPPVPTKNLITGKVYFLVSGRPLVAQRVTVYLIAEPPPQQGAATRDADVRYGTIDSTRTDSTGTYIFQNVETGTYRVALSLGRLAGTRTVGTIVPGQYVMNVNIPIVLNPQITLTKSGPAFAHVRDTLTYTLSASNSGTFSVDSVVLRDSLDASMEFVSATAGGAFDPVSRSVRWFVGTLDSTGGSMTSFTASITVRMADSVRTPRSVVNSAAMSGINIVPDIATQAVTQLTATDLVITKAAQRRIVEVGDAVVYAVSVTNNMTGYPVLDVRVQDTPPLGFSYAAGSSFRGAVRLAEPRAAQTLEWTVADTLRPGETVRFTYRMIAGAGALDGNGINRALALASTPTGRVLASAMAEERVDVRAGVFTDRGLIVGKVFYDGNRNAYQDPGETGVKGVELMTEDGTRVVTGDEGKFSFPDVRPGEHVLRIRRHTLPPGAEPLPGNNDFAGDGVSRFVTVTPGGIARADFYLFQTTPDTLHLSRSVARAGRIRMTRWTDPMNLIFVEDERRAPMKLTGVNFEVGQAVLRAGAAGSLRELAQIMREYPDVSLLIVGHTDTIPIRTQQFPNNTVLSEARAQAVRTFLSANEAIDSSRIRTLGLGSSRPLAWNRTAEGRSLNRRVEFYFNDDFDPKPLHVASVLMQVAIEHDGDLPVREVRFRDDLDSLLRYVPGSGVLDDAPFAPEVHNGHVRWVIREPGRRFSTELSYRVEIDKPDDRVLSMWTTTRSIEVRTDSGVVRSDSTVSTINHVAVATIGRAVNFVMSGILFNVASANLRPAAYSALDDAARYLRENPTSTLVVEGHTDATPIGTAQFASNVALSRARAETVARLLATEHGIEPARMRTFGFGALRPVASNDDAAGRERNRRVEMRVYKREFTDSVLQAGRIDSSSSVVATVVPHPGVDVVPTSDTLRAGEQYRVTIGLRRPITAKTATLTLVDTLAPQMRLVPGSLAALSGIRSIAGERVIRAVARARAAEVRFTYVVELTADIPRSDFLDRPYWAVRLERTGSTVLTPYTRLSNGIATTP